MNIVMESLLLWFRRVTLVACVRFKKKNILKMLLKLHEYRLRTVQFYFFNDRNWRKFCEIKSENISSKVTTVFECEHFHTYKGNKQLFSLKKST